MEINVKEVEERYFTAKNQILVTLSNLLRELDMKDVSGYEMDFRVNGFFKIITFERGTELIGHFVNSKSQELFSLQNFTPLEDIDPKTMFKFLYYLENKLKEKYYETRM